MRWLEKHERRLHERRVSPAAFGVLLALAVVQGLLVVALYAGGRALFRDEPEDKPAATAAAAAVKPSVAPAPAPAPAPAKSLESAAAPAEAAAPVAGRTPDGSGKSAPDCKTIFGNDAPPDGFYPGAAWQEVRSGRSAIVRGDLEAAQKAFCRAVTWDKENAEVALHLAQVLLLLRDGPQALQWAEKAAALDPRSLRVQEALGDALARVGAHSEARTAWLTAARIDPSDQRGVRGLVVREVREATKATRNHKLVVAEKYYRRAALLEPKSWSAMIGLSYVLLELGEVKPAVTWAERAAAAAPRNASVRLILGDALMRSGDKAAAIASWRESSLLDPGNREARKRLRDVL
jgi:tetratricopeptide (TPR) repeat protein